MILVKKKKKKKNMPETLYCCYSKEHIFHEQLIDR